MGHIEPVNALAAGMFVVAASALSVWLLAQIVRANLRAVRTVDALRQGAEEMRMRGEPDVCADAARELALDETSLDRPCLYLVISEDDDTEADTEDVPCVAE